MTQHMKYTPGPWHTDSKNPCWIQDRRGKDILSYRHLKPAEVEANARLIAAAPRMHDVVRILADAERWSGKSAEYVLAAAQKEARAILRDVEGESNG